VVPSISLEVASFKIDVATGGRVDSSGVELHRSRRDHADVRKATLIAGTLENHAAQMRAMKGRPRR